MAKVSGASRKKAGQLKKTFDLDFDLVKIRLPDNSVLEEHISEHLLVNQDLPPDVLAKMAQCAPRYARWGVVSADLVSYLKLLNEEYQLFIGKHKSTARKKAEKGHNSETAFEEAAILANLEEHIERKKHIRLTEKAIEKVKRVMRALEMQSEMLRSISSYMKKEIEMTGEDRIIGRGSLTKNRRKRNA